MSIKPFEYEIYDNFLEKEDFDKISEIYKNSEFKELNSDLFKFLQTNELCVKNEEKMKFFTNNLNKIFIPRLNENNLHDKCIENNICENNFDKNFYYTIFGSFYRKGDFLLCHDDCIEQREYAFTFYLDNNSSGDLILYENDCKTIHKKINIIKNRLVIFKVGPKSFHEVEYCNSGNRRAITGWINNKNKENWELLINNKNYENDLIKNNLPKNIEFINDLPIEVTDEYNLMEVGEFDFKELNYEISESFIDRRAIKINLEEYFAPKINNYKLVSLEYLLIEKNGYILCNDKINTNFKNKNNLLDIFIFKNDYENFIKFVNENGEIEYQLDAVANCMLYGKRKGFNIFISNSEKEVKFIHLIYELNQY